MLTKTGVRVAFLAAMLLISACSRHHLGEYNFSNRTVALVYVDPPEPDLLHGWYGVRRNESTIQTVVRAGAGVAKEIEAHRASARLDSAAARVNIPRRLADRTLERASRYLGTRVARSTDSADFVLEIHLRSFGIDARSSHATYLFTRAEAVLLDRRTGREIWHKTVRGSDRMTPFVVGTRDVPSNIFTAATLHTVTVADFQEALEQLVTYSSNLIVDELRDKLRDVRD